VSKLNGAVRLSQDYNRQTLFDVIRKIEEQVNTLSEGGQAAYYGARTSAPTVGDYKRGDWVKNSAPSSAGYFGWVCTVSGTPGTWKGFGVIA